MKYENIREGRFVSRPNRFIAKVNIDGAEETVHVKNTGRCKELLVPNARVYLTASDNQNRKTKYDLIAVEKKGSGGEPFVVNMDSQVVNLIAEEAFERGFLFPSGSVVRREVTYGNSRFDFYIENQNEKAFLEVKGVTLEADGLAMFPDAPTERGVKHINELIRSVDDGFSAYILFVIQIKNIKAFTPNDGTHKEFGDALRKAKEKGVKIYAVNCDVTPDSLQIDTFTEVLL